MSYTFEQQGSEYLIFNPDGECVGTSGSLEGAMELVQTLNYRAGLLVPAEDAPKGTDTDGTE